MSHIVNTLKTVLIDRATDIAGRSDRSEYWWYMLYAGIINLALMIVDNHVIGFTFYSILEPFGERKDSGVLSALFVLGTLVQNVCLSARRLHDRGHSGWWQLGLLVPFLNFMVIYWLARDAKDTPDALNYVNPYGARD
ncbi:DUF805 domain-containing protein [Gammaproteobacteria bacterium]|nr:DUF805 domain-containing protein [Gammaproteobacteria bacterium]MDA9010928.1 DUF805 domain-containing protein [Gammaproteobacteria bacterium]MDA9117888.1 DUF805 domain-containing protein [Gammaproteobacteria bacterium]MDA9212288.1 DUF805 domain-containing protein [Gammaproteobacteria bacterium]MDB4591677.1 DUF805 domain-containing protein [Gammaproteobacteria bacterium]|tara:strand:+ start:430 stop:843 length:414 start_codon:yes stop_codon:yes gene_type:complete